MKFVGESIQKLSPEQNRQTYTHAHMKKDRQPNALPGHIREW